MLLRVGYRINQYSKVLNEYIDEIFSFGKIMIMHINGIYKFIKTTRIFI